MDPKHDATETKPLRRKVLNFAALAVLAASAVPAHGLSLAASATQTQFDFHELTGEEILEVINAAGGAAVVKLDPETGLIDEISASIETGFEYDYDEMTEVIDSLQATGVVPKKLLGDLAQTSVSVSIAFNGTLTTGSTSVTGVSSTAGLSIGLPVTGTGVAANTTIAAIPTPGTNGVITLSTAATASGAATALTAAGEQQVICLAEWTLDWKRKTPDATTTDDGEYESSVASTKSWSVKAKYMFCDGDPSQAGNILAFIDTTQVDYLTWNFFPTISSGRLAFQGTAIVDGITMGTGIGKVVGLDVSLKGTGPLTRMTQIAPVTTTTTATGQQAEV